MEVMSWVMVVGTAGRAGLKCPKSSSGSQNLHPTILSRGGSGRSGTDGVDEQYLPLAYCHIPMKGELVCNRMIIEDVKDRGQI